MSQHEEMESRGKKRRGEGRREGRVEEEKGGDQERREEKGGDQERREEGRGEEIGV